MNLELAEQIVALLGEYPVSEISVEQEGRRVCVRKPQTLPLPALPFAEASESANDELPIAVTSLPGGGSSPELVSEEARVLTATMVGIFHHTEPPLPYAASVRSGQVIGYIESMKLMNDVVADEGGRVTDVLVEDGAPVEYGQALFRLAA